VHQERRARVIEKLSEGIRAFEVGSGRFLRFTRDSCAAADAELDSNLRQRLRFISERPLRDFAIGWLSERLVHEFDFQPDAPARPLVELRGFEDSAVVAGALVDAFEGLPRSYTLILPLPLTSGFADAPFAEHREYELGEGVSLVSPGPDYAGQFESRPQAGAFLEIFEGRQRTRGWMSGTPPAWSNERLLLKMKRTGYISPLVETATAAEARLFVRGFAGLLESTLLAETDSAPPTFGFSQGLYGGTYIYAFEDRPGQLPAPWVGSVLIDEEHATRLKSLQWPADREDLKAWNDWIGFVRNYIRPAIRGPEVERLLSAAQWYFDSQCGSNPLLQFVQATTAIEIIYGDKARSDVIGLGELLANRCAFSLGRTLDERTQLLKTFKTLYDTRSRIVHAGKATLTELESEQLWRLRQICSRVLNKEMRLRRPATNAWEA
jgi:hypothetical protein